MQCVEAVSTAMSVMPIENGDRRFANLGARPKRSSLKKNGRYARKMSFHQQSLEEALEMKNVNSLENINGEVNYEYVVAKRIDRKLSIGPGDGHNFNLDFVPAPAKLQLTNIDGTKSLKKVQTSISSNIPQLEDDSNSNSPPSSSDVNSKS